MTPPSDDGEELAKFARLRDQLDAAPVPTSLAAARALKARDNTLWTPAECLVDCFEDIQSGKAPCDKLLIVRVDTLDEKFNIGYHCANMKASEILAALECVKAQILHEMGYIE